jgi:hypothetical protein
LIDGGREVGPSFTYCHQVVHPLFIYVASPFVASQKKKILPSGFFTVSDRQGKATITPILFKRAIAAMLLVTVMSQPTHSSLLNSVLFGLRNQLQPTR